MGGHADTTFQTAGGITVRRIARDIDYPGATEGWIARLDHERGAVFSSAYEYPGRYTRWDFGLIAPPLVVEARARIVTITALNDRGTILLPAIARTLAGTDGVVDLTEEARRIRLRVAEPGRPFTEEERTRLPSVFSVVRAITGLFFSEEDDKLGLAGAFGYDLAFQLEPITQRMVRPDDQRDLILFLPDEILAVDHYGHRATVYAYDFTVDGRSTEGLPRTAERTDYRPGTPPNSRGDHEPGEYADTVRLAFQKFARGDLFEVVPGQTFTEPCPANPSDVARTLAAINPAPYGFFMNLGRDEWLVGASPEMFVRVSGKRVETCPISGTIKRGRDAIEDAEQIRILLNSRKDESELTMCSDVDRNDKSRICVPGSVRVLGRRQIEMYSRLIHTVDHIEGMLRDGFDALDAFLTHAWAVTVTGAPKTWAMRFIEEHERSPRAWYGGAVGMVHFNGDLNTGLTLRTVRIKNGIAEVRAGATVLADSDPDAEEKETELKASAMLAAIREAGRPKASAPAAASVAQPGRGRRLLLVDHEDSFVHTLANYFRQTGADVTTVRAPVDDAVFERVKPDLVVLSPGPGCPSDFNTADTIGRARARGLPIFGVCLGLQALTEYFGGRLYQLDVPMHGKPSVVTVTEPGRLFAGMDTTLTVGRYHSLAADRSVLPAVLKVTAESEDGAAMAIEHVSEPIAAVQFHPESIMTLADEAGMRILRNAVERLTAKAAVAA